MSNTYIHKDHAKYMNKIIDTPSKTLQCKYNRHNFEKGEFINLRNNLKLKDLIKFEGV